MTPSGRDRGARTSTIARTVRRVAGGRVTGEFSDALAAEEPLEIKVAHGPDDRRRSIFTVSLTMRTPGGDDALAAGFLYTEGVIADSSDIRSIGPVGMDWLPGETANAVLVDLAPRVILDIERLSRHVFTSSSCGICGKTSIESVRSAARAPLPETKTSVAASTLLSLPERLREQQAIFEQTGGLHASALFDGCGSLVRVTEDVGRHNALDKLIGAELLAGGLPLGERVLLVSGRASFELVQKAVMAGIPILAAVGAPSSLAADLAEEFGMTLVGFLRGDRFNIYTRPDRIISNS